LNPYKGIIPQPGRVVLNDNLKFLAIRQEVIDQSSELLFPKLVSSDMSERFMRSPDSGYMVEQTEQFKASYYGNADATIFVSAGFTQSPDQLQQSLKDSLTTTHKKTSKRY